MRTHCPHFDNFTFITLTTAAEADRAVKELHNKRFLNQRVIVSLQRSNGGSANQATGQKSRSRITSMGPSNACSGKNPAMGFGRENSGTQFPVINQLPPRIPVHAQPMPPSSDPRGPVRLPNPYLNHMVTYNQHHQTLPTHPPPPANYRHFNPTAPVNLAPFNHKLGHPFPPASIPGAAYPAAHQPPPGSSGQPSRRGRGRRKQFPPQYDGPSDYPPSAPLSTSIKRGVSKPSAEANNIYDSAVQMSTPSTASTLSTAPSSGSPYCGNQTWPPLVSSDAVPESRAWTSFHDNQLDDAYQTLTGHCHDVECLVSAGFNIKKPIMPPVADLKAKVKCRSCRNSRQRLDRLIAEEGQKGCPVARDGMHSFGGISHLKSRYEDFEHPPAVGSTSLTIKRRAIALDCEMAGGRMGDGLVDQLIQLTAIDYFTGEVLISALVKPTLDIRQWRTNIHGVNHGMILQADRDGTALRDVFHAREVLFSYMDKSTILVGHALHHDLNVLKIAHDRCVDSEVLVKDAINRPGQSSGTGLKKACDSLMGLGVQRMANHSCLEDSFAAREAVIFMTSRPEELAIWAEAKQKAIDEEVAKRLAARQEKEEAKKQAAIAEAKEKAAAADDKQVQKVLTMAMPALVPTPANETSNDSQVNRGPYGRKKRRTGRVKNGSS
jgi:DNA polymerase III epsilon subunit-like protein/RNA recognition motif-containing protein